MFGSAESEHPRLTTVTVKLFLNYSNLCDHNSPTSQTERHTYGETIARPRSALNVHRAVKILKATISLTAIVVSDRTPYGYSRAYATVFRPSVRLCPSSVTVRIVAKRCVLEEKLLLTAYRKSYINKKPSCR